MTAARSLLIVAASAAIAAALAPTPASAHGRERDAFARLACWYAGGNPSYVPGPGPYFGYGGPSCEDREVIVHRHKHRRPRPLRVRG
jgi:hypothetical protein